MESNKHMAREVLRLRLGQMIVNQGNKNKDYKCPIHLALGHEAIAVAVNEAMHEKDWLLLSHRNIHYNLARSHQLSKKIKEYLLMDDGEAGGQLGCMNMFNESKRVLYTSSILANQLAVASGVAMANRFKEQDGWTIVVTGDGAIEEGTFQESLMMMKTFSAPAMVLVENNQWSLATQIHERRCQLKLDFYAAAFDIPYYRLEGNDVYEYLPVLKKIRERSMKEGIPVIVEVILHTLGDWRMKTDEYPDGKYINYHAGAAPNVELSGWPVIEETERDPVFLLTKRFDRQDLAEMSSSLLASMQKELL